MLLDRPRRREAAGGHGLKDQFFDLIQQEFIAPYLLIGRKWPTEGDRGMTIAEYAILATLVVAVMVSVCLGFLGREF